MVGVQRAIKRIKTRRRLKGKYLRYLWDFIEYNSVAIELGFKPSACEGRCDRGVVVEGPKGHLLVNRGARIGSGVYIDVRLGPVIVDEMAQVLPFSRIRGPCYIGPKTIIDGARISGGCSFGPDCRVSGEVEASILQGHANKRHEGFLGHSFIGEWVNLGAGTTNSDLKNNYGPIRVMMGRKEVDTGLAKVGCFIGDHTKTGIGTLLPTGASLGVFVNFFGGGMTPREVASFKWGSGHKLIGYRLDDAIKTAQTVMQRRGMRLTGSDENMIRRLYAELNRR
jgi:UDP-N-acetylglucosamine diphosphorylase/glucosamine-1-phosphate N-acetyltransferase